MICSAPRRLAAIPPHKPTAPSPTTATRLPGATLATTAAWWPVPITSERGKSEGISASASPTGGGGGRRERRVVFADWERVERAVGVGDAHCFCLGAVGGVAAEEADVHAGGLQA